MGDINVANVESSVVETVSARIMGMMVRLGDDREYHKMSMDLEIYIGLETHGE